MDFLQTIFKTNCHVVTESKGMQKTPEFDAKYDPHSSPRRLAEEKKSYSYNHKTTIWVSHEYYLNPEFHKILSRAF